MTAKPPIETTSKCSSKKKPPWEHIACSVTGARHVQNNTPCQDAVKVISFADNGFVLAVADGHGDSRHCHSDRGSEIAVNVACNILQQALLSLDQDKSAIEIEQILKTTLPQRIAWEWNRLCKKEMGLQDDGEWVEELIQYGSTLIACGMTTKWIICYQLGDGDLILANSSPRYPFREDDLMGVFTHSLCQPNHHEKANVLCQQNTFHQERSFILLSTDGIRDSLDGSRDKMLHFVNWLQQKIHKDGKEQTQISMQKWLSELSLRGNGDDNSFALLYQPYMMN